MNVIYDLLYLIRCAFYGQAPDKQRVMNMNMDEIYKISCQHKLAAMVAMALETIPDGPVECMGAERWGKWNQVMSKSVRKQVLFDAERAKHFDFFEKNGIWYVPLKGILLKEFYPRYGMREMADNDILYDSKHEKQVCKYMKSCGYKVKSFGGKHDTYHKDPIYNFELHNDLVSDQSNLKFLAKYYSNVKDRLIKDEQNNYGYHFSSDDFYVHVTAHAFIHYDGGGTGLRTLVDNFVFRQVKKDDLHFDIIDRELEKLGILSFDLTVRSLGDFFLEKQSSVRDSDVLSDDEKHMLSYMVASGVYGTWENATSHRMDEFLAGSSMTGGKKSLYVLQRLFPSFRKMKLYSPMLNRYPVFLPVMYVYRLFEVTFKKRDRIKIEMGIMKSKR